MMPAVCLACAELWEGGSTCRVCGRGLVRGREALRAWERARHRQRLERWASEGALDEVTARALRARLDDEAASGDEAGGAGAGATGAARGGLGGERAPANTGVERGADALVAGTAAFGREVSARWARLARAVEEGDARAARGEGEAGRAGGVSEPEAERAGGVSEPEAERAGGVSEPEAERAGGVSELEAARAGGVSELEAARAGGASEPEAERAGGEGARSERAGAEAGRAIFARGAAGVVVGAGVEALAALDDAAEGGEGRPLGALEVFWFIGTVFVLAGSVLGVREAWQSLEGVLRPLAIAGAFFAYHALFVGLARALVRRSAVTGGVLTVIASGLVPVAFAAAAVAIGQRPALGVPFALALLGASAATLAFAGRSAAGAGAGLALAWGLSPALVLELLIGAGGAPPGRRVGVALAALAPVALAVVRLRRAKGRGLAVGLSAAAYGAFVVGVLALYGGPGDAVLDPDDDALALRAIVGWVAVASALGWWATSAGALAERGHKYGAVARVVALAALVGAACAAFFAGLDGGAGLGLAAHAPVAVLALATGVLALEQRARRGALHVAVPVALAAAVAVGRSMAPTRPGVETLSCAAVAAALLALSGRPAERARRVGRSAWGLVVGALSAAGALSVDGRAGTAVARAVAPWSAVAVGAPWAMSAAAAALLALAAHAGAGRRRPWLHYPAASFALVAALALFAPPRPEPFAFVAMLACAGLGAVYGLVALAGGALAAGDADRRPLDDASLALAALGVWVGGAYGPDALAPALVLAAGPAPGAAPAPVAVAVFAAGGPFLAAAAPALALAALLFARARRDRSGLVVALGAAALALAARLAAGAPTPGRGVFVGGAAAFVCALIATARAPRDEGAPPFGRALFGLVPLPLGGRGRALLDGFAVAAVGLAVVVCARGADWLVGVRPEAERPLVVSGVALALATAVVAFATRAFELVAARGAALALWCAGAGVALAAVANRVGRPLPPAVVGARLSLVVVLVWLAARALVALGPRLGRALGREADGARYHLVPHAGVAALGLLLIVDAALVGAPTATRALAVVPPLLLVGGAAGAFLLYRSFGREPLLHVGLLSLLGAAALGAAQRAVLGPDLVPLDPPGGRWVPRRAAESAALDWLNPAALSPAEGGAAGLWARAWLGLGAAALIFALALLAATRLPAFARALRGLFARSEGEAPELERGLALAVFAATLLAYGLVSAPSLPAAAALLAAGALSAFAAAPALRALPLALAAPAFLHALAQGGARVPPWAGPSIAALALLAVALGHRASARRGRDASVLGKAQLVALAYAPLAVAYAFAAGGPTAKVGAAGRVLDLATAAAAGAAPLSFSSALALALLALALASSAFAWRGGLATLLAAGAPPLLAAAGCAFAAALTRVAGPGATATLVAREGAMLSLGLAAAAAAAHAAAFAADRRGRDDAQAGLALGRDVVLVASALAMAAFVASRAPGGLAVAPAGVGALGLGLVVSLHAATWKGGARHVALAEALLVAVYAFATRELDLRPEIHATAGLLYGFSLVSVVVIARRRGAAHFAGATRWFVAALPAALAWLTADGDASRADAAFALGASALYGTVAWAERSRAFGSLASLAANLGLVAFALAQGLDGVEIYLGPLGILVAALAQIFAPALGAPARAALRVLGGALLYLPAGLKLTLRLGAAEDGTYSVAFGAACLLGVALGVALRVRAYLALGTLFLTLDVVANLVHAGLRDHRVGFVLLSASGLAILGGMIAITLRRDRLVGALRRLRARLRGWD